MVMPKLVLIEDQKNLRREYVPSLIEVGFEVFYLSRGDFLERFLEDHDVDVILSDTDQEYYGEGPDNVEKVLGKGLIGEDVLVIGMSDDSDNKQYWRGLAHVDCFYDKDYFHEDEIGEIAMQCFRNFHSDCKAWRYRMPGDRSRE